MTIPTLLALLALPSPQEPVEPTADAAAIGVEAAEALEAANWLAFSFERVVTGPDGSVVERSSGTGHVARGTAERGLLAWLSGSRAPGDADAQRVWLVADGEDVLAYDAARDVLWTSGAHQAGALLTETHGEGAIAPLTVPDTYRNLATYRPELAGSEEVDGVRCDVISMDVPGADVPYRLWIGREDRLPRRLERPGDDGGTTRVTWSGLRGAPFEGSADERPEAEVRAFTLGGPAPGDLAPDWTLETREGGTLALAQLRGQVVLLDFWATWCAPCLASMPGLQEVYEEHADQGLVVIGARWNDPADPTRVLKRLGVTYPIADGDALAGDYGLKASGIPALFVIDRQGRVRDYFLGYAGESTEARLRRVVETVLAED